MSSSSIFVLLTEKRFNEEIEYSGVDDIGNSGNELVMDGNPDFFYHFSYISSEETHETLEERIEAAKEIVDCLGEDICNVTEDGILVFPAGAKEKYAKKCIKQLIREVAALEEKAYFKLQRHLLKETVMGNYLFVNFDCDSIQSIDDFIEYHIEDNKEGRFVVVRTILGHA